MCPACNNIVKNIQDGKVCNQCDRMTCNKCFINYNAYLRKPCMICQNEDFTTKSRPISRLEFETILNLEFKCNNKNCKNLVFRHKEYI